MTTNIQKWGNSQGIRLPKVLLDALNWHENEEIELTAKDNTIVITKAKPQRKTIQELFEGYDGEYEHTDIDWGEPMGAEIW